MQHPTRGFTLLRCYIQREGSLRHNAISDVLAHSYLVSHLYLRFTHFNETSLDLVHSTNLLHQISWLTRKRCYIIWVGSLTPLVTSKKLAHSDGLLHHSLWFALFRCYIHHLGSLISSVTSTLLAHSYSVLYRRCGFTLVRCYVLSHGSLRRGATSC